MVVKRLRYGQLHTFDSSDDRLGKVMLCNTIYNVNITEIIRKVQKILLCT